MRNELEKIGVNVGEKANGSKAPLKSEWDSQQSAIKLSKVNNKNSLSRREYAILKSEVVRKNAMLRNESDNMINGAFTDNNYYVYETWGDDSFSVMKTIPISGNEELIQDIQRIIRKGINGNGTDTASTIFDEIAENLRIRRRRNNGSYANTSREQTNRNSGKLVGQQPPSDTNGNIAKGSGNKSRLSKEKKPTEDVGSFNAHRNELLNDAEEYYGSKYTDNFNETGFIFPDGKLPKMGDYGQRAEDHNVVIGLYDDIGYGTHQAPKTTAMGRFLDEGNIRIMPENGSLEISSRVEPTPEQYSAIRNYLAEHNEATIEFSDINGKSVDSKDYSNGVNPTQVVNDIKRFYQDGKIGGSQVAMFRFSKESKEAKQFAISEFAKGIPIMGTFAVLFAESSTSIMTK